MYFQTKKKFFKEQKIVVAKLGVCMILVRNVCFLKTNDHEIVIIIMIKKHNEKRYKNKTKKEKKNSKVVLKANTHKTFWLMF